VLVHPYAGNLEQKRFALAQCKGAWVVLLDADEALSPALAARLRACLAAPGPGCDGLELDRVAHHLGRRIRHGDFHPDWQLRAFRRAGARIEGRNPHGRVRVPGRVRRIPGELEHRSYASLADQVERIQEFSAIEAAALFAEGHRAGFSQLALRPALRFARGYLLRQGFRDGVPGLVVAAASAFHVFLKYAKLWELGKARGFACAPGSRRSGWSRGLPPH
jgi:hypothetical protein